MSAIEDNLRSQMLEPNWVEAAVALRLTGVDPAEMRDWEIKNLKAVAAAIGAVHNRYEQLAKWADQQADSREPFAKVDPSYRMTLIPYRAMAERIRMVADR